MFFHRGLQKNVGLYRQACLDPEQRKNGIQEIEQQHNLDKAV